MEASSLHPTAVLQTVVYEDDSDAVRIVLERWPMSLEEYLRSNFHSDRDYADGYAEERNAGGVSMDVYKVSLFCTLESRSKIGVSA